MTECVKMTGVIELIDFQQDSQTTIEREDTGEPNKEIYGTRNGKSCCAWDRDWEIEFWKGRCDQTKQLKKW
jgi:hypothetical protein